MTAATMEAVDVEPYFKTLEKAALLGPEQIAYARRQAATQSLSPQQVADWLVQHDWLTKWQAEHALAGETAFYLGDYLLLDHIATGGMGTVYKARHWQSGKVVAAKLLSQESMDDPVTVQRFRREVELASTLQHPCIVAAYHADQIDGLYFLVMEYVEGADLWEWGRRYTQLPIDFACECIRQACVGLDYAMRRGMVHRDLKPANLMVTWPKAGGPPLCKILDMGLARFRSESQDVRRLTVTGQFVGTPDYVAPEQARNAKAADIRSDIYGLGVSLFELLTGRLPFAAASPMESIMRRERSEAPRLKTILPDIPDGLDEIVAKMLARDPEKRHQTPGAAAVELEPFCGNMRNPDV